MREHEYETEIDTRLEGKLGFDRVRTFVADRCSTEYAVTRVTEERFSDDPKVIRERLALTDEIKRTVFTAIEALPEDLRTAITLREMEGLSYEEIAEIMDCPVGTVRSRIFRAREAIDKKLQPLIEH